MAKDYFADVDSSESEDSHPSREDVGLPPTSGSNAGGERSIRNIAIKRRAATPPPASPLRSSTTDLRSERPMRMTANTSPRRSRGLLIWIVAGVSIVVLLGAGAFLAFADTKVVVTPRSHIVTFDESTQFKAFPKDTAATGTIAYTVQVSTLEDSSVVPASGTEKAEDRASGTITVYNNYSTSPVRLVKNTRFQTPQGQIFKVPSSVEIPGKKGAVPGQVNVTVIADAPGPSYNIGPVERFTLPGLEKSSPDMFKDVYAKSTAAFTGGFIGEKPAVTPAALDTARAEIRSRLQEKALAAAVAESGDTFIFPELMQITYESLPIAAESGGARIREKATVSIPTFSASEFASSIARAVSADAGEAAVTLEKGEGFRSALVDGKAVLGKDPVTFTLSGRGTLIWNVDQSALKEALAGREQAAFETIVGGFPGVDKAEASISPFWSSTFPKDPADIIIQLESVPRP